MNELDPPVPQPDACAALVALAEREASPGVTVKHFVDLVGYGGAGVRPGVAGIVDLALAGSNCLPGHGFRDDLDDGTGGQVRHFCGIAASCRRFGARPTWLVSVYLRRDPPDTPDGRLTDLAIEFVEQLRRGHLQIGDAASWLRNSLCAGQTTPDATGTLVDEPRTPAVYPPA